MPWPLQGRPLADHHHHDHHLGCKMLLPRQGLDDLTAGIQCPAPECALQPQGVEWLADAGFAGVVVVSLGLCQAERVVLSHPGSLSLRCLGKDLLQVGRSVSLPGGQQVASKPPAHHHLCAPVCLAAGLHPSERLQGWPLPDHSEGHHHLAFQIEENPLGGKQDLRTVGLVQPESAGAGLEISQALVSWPNAHRADQRQRPRRGLQAPTGPALQVPPSRIRPQSYTGSWLRHRGPAPYM